MAQGGALEFTKWPAEPGRAGKSMRAVRRVNGRHGLGLAGPYSRCRCRCRLRPPADVTSGDASGQAWPLQDDNGFNEATEATWRRPTGNWPRCESTRSCMKSDCPWAHCDSPSASPYIMPVLTRPNSSIPNENHFRCIMD